MLHANYSCKQESPTQQISNSTIVKVPTSESTANLNSSASHNNDNSSANMIPLELPAHALLCIYIVLSIITGTFFFNWPPTQQMYLRAGAYTDMCLVGEICHERLSTINALMPAGVAAMFASTLLGGFCLDYLGAKATALLGLASQLAGWGVLLYDNKQFLISVIFIGCGSEPMLLSLLNGANLFPTRRLTVMTLISASRIISYFIPAIINMVLDYPGWNLSHVCLSYMILLIGCVAIVFVFMPIKCFRCSSGNCSSQILSTIIISPPLVDVMKDYDNSFASLPTAADGGSSIASSLQDMRTFKLPKEFGPSRVFAAASADFYVKNNFDSNVSSAVGRKDKNSLSSVAPWISTPKAYLPLFPISATAILCGTFLANSSLQQLQGSLINSVWIIPLTFIPTALIGTLADHFSPRHVMMIANGFNFVEFLLLLIKDYNSIFSISANLFGSLATSFFLTQFYCFVATHFSELHFGRSCGFLTFFSGVVSLIATPMCDFSSFEGNFQVMNGLCLCLTALNFVWLAVLAKGENSLPS